MSYVSNHWYKSGDWNAVCDVCGFRFKSSKLRKRWDGLMVCDKDFEYDHPQKYIKVEETSQAAQWTRQDDASNFITVCYLYGISAYADLAEADCAQADNQDYTYDFLLSLKGSS